MSFASDAGYIPLTVQDLMSIIRVNVNSKLDTTYTDAQFVGTNFYKYFYALIQRLQSNEVKTAEILEVLRTYFTTTNERILRPNTTAPGLYDYFEDRGFQISVKPPVDTDAGKAFVCINVDSGASDYADTKLELCGYLKNCIVAGIVTQGDQVETLPTSNGQSFDFKYSLPNKIPVLLKLTITLSDNNMFSIKSPEEIKQALFDNIAARYRLGLNFEPERYFSVVDAPWASNVLLEWSDDDGDNYYATVYEADFDDIYTFDLDDISLVEA